MKKAIEKWWWLIFVTAAIYMLVRPSSPAVTWLNDLTTTITGAIATVTS